MAGAQFAMLRERMLAWSVVWCRCCGVAKNLRQKSAIYHEPPREQYESSRTKPKLEKVCHLSLLVCVGVVVCVCCCWSVVVRWIVIFALLVVSVVWSTQTTCHVNDGVKKRYL